MSEVNKIYLLRGNDTPLSVCLRKREGDGDPVPYDLSAAERIRLALVGHGAHVFASGVTVSGEDNNIVSGVIPGRALLKGDYDLEVTFTLDGRDKRFAVEDMFEAVDFLAEDADGETEGEGAGIWVNVTVQPEVIEIAGPTGPQGDTPVLTADEDGTIYADGVLLTEVVKDVTEAVESAERSRDSAEQARMVSEQSRVSAERARAQAEQVRQTAEQGRASSEQSRTIAETARETRAASDRATAQSDHATAANDHSVAASDHTTAATDHTIASSDHSTAVADHEASTSATEDANDAADAANDAAASVQHIVETRIGSETIHNIVELTQAEYDALQMKRDDTMYIITDTEIPSGEVGIAGFEQTAESTEDGGTNIWTVTLTNGQTFQLAVKNGKQGNSGYSGAAGELEVVNNLTDGGATAALSAEMGKELGEDMSQLRSEVASAVVEDSILKQVYSASTSASKTYFLPLQLYAGHRYHFKIVPNGLTIHSSATYSLTVRVYETLADDSPYTDILFMSRTDYTGQTVEFDYDAPITTMRVRFYIGKALAAGTGVEYTITEAVMDKAFARCELLASKNVVALPYILEQGSTLATGVKETTISTKRVRTRNLIKVYGKTHISIESGKEFYVHTYREDDWATQDGAGYAYTGDLVLFWDGYVSVTVKNTANTDLTPYDVSNLKVEATPLMTQLGANGKNVVNYGAAGDGVTDDSAAITAAVANGGIVYFQDGTYLVNNPIPLKSNTELFLSPGATILRGANIKALFYTDWEQTTTGYDGVNNLVIRGGCMDMGSGYSQGGFPIGLIHAAHVRIQDVTFKGPNAGYHCIDICGVKDIVVRGCVFKGILTNTVYAECVQIDNALAYNHFPIKFDGTYACWDGTPCDGVEITGCRFELNDYSPAIGNHNVGLHKRIDIHDNVIIGTSSQTNTRGAIVFGTYAAGEENYTDIVAIHDNTVINMAIGFQIETDGLVVVKNNILVNVATLKTAGSQGTFDGNVIN